MSRLPQVPMFGNRIPAKDLNQKRVPSKYDNQTNERGDLSQKIVALQEKLGVSRAVILREDELVKCTLKFLVKFHGLLMELQND